jgi:energy-coupling factor transport system ATP-binding protein
MALVEVDGLRFSYGGEAPVLRNVTLRIDVGEHVALLGASGSGKSTLLRALAGLVPHFHGGTFAGRVVVAGRDTRETRPAELAGDVASVFQDPEDQIVMARVANEVAFGLENTGAPPEEIWRRAEEALALVGAEHLADRAAAELSGGELQRVALASALALRPRLLLLDEPSLGIGPILVQRIYETIGEINRSGVAILLVEQNANRALDVASRGYVLETGRVALANDSASLQNDPRVQKAYLGT